MKIKLDACRRREEEEKEEGAAAAGIEKRRRGGKYMAPAPGQVASCSLHRLTYFFFFYSTLFESEILFPFFIIKIGSA